MKLHVWIAAHAVAAKPTLVMHDNAFSLVPGGVLAVEDWIVMRRAGQRAIARTLQQHCLIAAR